MRSLKTVAPICVALLGLVLSKNAAGDAIVVSKAMSASTIAEVYVEADSLRIELEIGPADVAVFKNLMPEAIYSKLEEENISENERHKRFFENDFTIRDDQNRLLIGNLEQVEARRRIVRDEITGEPVPSQPADAELVIYAVLKYSFHDRPGSLTIAAASGSPPANIGFITYHLGLPVTEFRYLSQPETVDLDWSDPWFSKYRNPNLRRQYDSPVSAFLYVEPFEVRKEIVIRPADLQRWIDLGVDVHGTIPIGAQAELKARVVEFLKDRHSVTIDGKVVEADADRIHFIRRTLRRTGVIVPDEDLPGVSATLGVIFVYPIDELPQQVEMKWEMFDDQLQSVPAVATDEASGFPAVLTPDDPALVWKNFLKNPTIPAMRSVPVPPSIPSIHVPLVSCFFWLTAVGLLVSGILVKRKGQIVAALILGVLGFLAYPLSTVAVENVFATRQTLDQQQADSVMESLIHNVYRAFDRRQESLVYDQLAVSLSGDVLTDIYLQTRRRIELADQGGAQINIDEVKLIGNKITSTTDEALDCRCHWTVSGTVGHWGHFHTRQLGFEADFRVEAIGDAWKITSMQIVNESIGPVTVGPAP